MKKLHETGRLDLLDALKKKEQSFPELLLAERNEKLNEAMSDMSLGRPLWTSIEQTAPKMKAGPNTVKRYGVAYRALQRKGKKWLRDNAKVRDLMKVDWVQLEREWQGSASDWMNLKTAVSAFVTTFLEGDVYHPFARKIRRSIPNRQSEARKNRLSIADFRSVVEKTPAHAQSSYWVLAITGMRLGEYLATTRSDLDVRDKLVYVPGTKTKGSKAPIAIAPALWPWIESGVPSKLRSRWLRLYWKRAVEDAGFTDVRLHDLRHCTGRWMIEAGVLEADAQRYLRHSNPQQTRDYVQLEETRHSSAKLAKALSMKPKKRKQA